MDRLCKSCKLVDEGSYWVDKAHQKACIFVLWHQQILPIPSFFNRLYPSLKPAALIDSSPDASLYGKLLGKYHWQCIPRNKNSFRSTIEACSQALDQNKPLFIVLDGPKGPFQQIKKGAIYLSQKHQVPIIPISWKGSYHWFSSSWDRMTLPLPFTRVKLKVSPPLNSHPSSTSLPLEEKLYTSLIHLN